MSRHYLALIPLLSLMAISPFQLKVTSVHRSPANHIEELNDSPYPKYEARAKKIDIATLAVDKQIALDKYFEKSKVNSERVTKEKKEFKRDIKVKAELELQQKMLNEVVLDLVIQDIQLKELLSKKAFEHELSQQLAENSLKENKIKLESLLIDVMDNEFLVLREEMFALEKKEVAKKEEVKEEPKKEEKPVDEKKEEVAKVDEDKKADYEKRICDIEDKNKVLMEQVNKLVTDQSKIIDIMLSMQQQMLQRPAFTPYYAYPQVQQPVYQYQQQAPMAQYSLMPQQQQQQPVNNIWGSPQAPQPQDYQPIMGVSPQSYTQYDPRYSTQANQLTGQFGGTGQMGFNFGGDQMFASQFQPQPHLSLI